MGPGRKLAKRRKALQRRGPAAEWSQRAVASRLNLAVDTIIRLETDRNVKLSTYRDVADEIARGERQPMQYAPEPSPMPEDLELPGHANLVALYAQVLALADRFAELLDLSHPQPQLPAPKRAPLRSRSVSRDLHR